MTTFNYDDVYTPDFSTQPNLPVDLDAPYTVYNLKLDGQYAPNSPNFYVCKNCLYFILKKFKYQNLKM
jgi:hypothetical protein